MGLTGCLFRCTRIDSSFAGLADALSSGRLYESLTCLGQANIMPIMSSSIRHLPIRRHKALPQRPWTRPSVVVTRLDNLARIY